METLRQVRKRKRPLRIGQGEGTMPSSETFCSATAAMRVRKLRQWELVEGAAL
jgi:hypothetical protein